MESEALDNYLTYMEDPWPQEEQERRKFVAEGPAATDFIIRRVQANLKLVGRVLDHPLPMISRKAAQVPVLIYERAARLLVAITDSFPQGGGAMVANQLLFLLSDKDPDLRALAAIYCGVKGIPLEFVIEPLQRLFLSDPDELVRVAAATSFGREASISGSIQKQAMLMVSRFIQIHVPEGYERAEDVKRQAHFWEKKTASTATNMVYFATTIVLVHRAIALR